LHALAKRAMDESYDSIKMLVINWEMSRVYEMRKINCYKTNWEARKRAI